MAANDRKASRIAEIEEILGVIEQKLNKSSLRELLKVFSIDELQEISNQIGAPISEFVYLDGKFMAGIDKLDTQCYFTHPTPPNRDGAGVYTKAGLTQIRQTLGGRLEELRNLTNEGLCPRCQDHESITWQSLCRYCFDELKNGHGDNFLLPDDFVLLCVSHIKSFESFAYLGLKLGISVLGDNFVYDIFGKRVQSKIRLFIAEDNLPTAQHFLEAIRKVAKKHGESVEDVFTPKTVSATYLDWTPPAKENQERGEV